MPPMPAEWWLRPVSSAALVGEQRAVVWKRLYFSPAAASFSAFGVWQGPPKALEEPNPASSIRITSTLGAPLGGRNCSIGGNLVSGSFASYVIRPVRGGSGMGRTLRGRSFCELIGLSHWVMKPSKELIQLLCTKYAKMRAWVPGSQGSPIKAIGR